jgi:7-keto-8-aminopelargonate synthetase-like enzyme
MSRTGEQRRQTLRRNLSLFADCMPQLFGPERKIQSAIIPVIVGTSERALEAAQTLSEKGFFVPAIRYPTVPKDSARLRVTVSAKHTSKQISALCQALQEILL